jgi:AraC family transcriptional regulator
MCDAVMRIAHLGAADLGSVRTRNCLDILVPKETANLFTSHRMEAARDRTAYVRAPLVAVVPPALPHSLADRLGSNTLILSIAEPFFSETARAALGSDDFSFVEPHAATDSLIREVADAVGREFPSLDRLTVSFLNALAALLAAHVVRNYLAAGSAKAMSTGGLAAHKMRCVRTFVAEHLGETIRVEQLAAQVHLSPFYFARIFKQSTDQSPRCTSFCSASSAPRSFWPAPTRRSSKWPPMWALARKATSPASFIATAGSRPRYSG